jgi:hypothetical protein
MAVDIAAAAAAAVCRVEYVVWWVLQVMISAVTGGCTHS